MRSKCEKAPIVSLVIEPILFTILYCSGILYAPKLIISRKHLQNGAWSAEAHSPKHVITHTHAHANQRSHWPFCCLKDCMDPEWCTMVIPDRDPRGQKMKEGYMGKYGAIAWVSLLCATQHLSSLARHNPGLLSWLRAVRRWMDGHPSAAR